MIPWILALIQLCAPVDAPRDRFIEVAEAIDDAADGDVELVRVLVALAARESHFIPDALGWDAFGESYGLWQLHESNLPNFGLEPEQVFIPKIASKWASLMIQQSQDICRNRPREDQLGWYASGGPTCDVPEGLEASRNRMKLADWLLQKRPPFWSSGRLETSVLPKHPRGFNEQLQ
jgi:Transglycosylase SLT domain